MKGTTIHEALNPIKFLSGNWTSVKAQGHYPTIKDFTYEEQLEFSCIGQPIFIYKSLTFNPETKNAMHQETGFWRMKPGSNEISCMIAHNFGLTSLEEGNVDGNCITLTSTSISRMEFAKEPAVKSIKRKITYDPIKDELNAIVEMETTNTPLREHLNVVYKRN